MASSTSALPAVSAVLPSLSKKPSSQLNPDPAKTTNAAAPVTARPSPRQLRFTGAGAGPAPMGTRGKSAIATGFAILVFAASAGAGVNFSSSAIGLLLSFAGVLAGVNVIAIGVRITKVPVLVNRPAVFACAGTLPGLRRRGLAVVGLLVASSAVTAVANEAGAGVSFMMFVLLLLGVSMINAGVVRGAY